ncbi:His Kinase A (phospho-acceptor) domain-containing protein [Thermosyntropha lipolytica DSM 11003]|uniref:Stage 0 sporulation protein A homolog n=1 Tax=Thermosyntropha lipolytica DSM 11003 TaxID=1123382 RepID=A0A1M5JFS6_9FIRM|nr:response regulator [Thermosyntropha lipolytica]SHG39432.1 His Kinase A (phospho-acceptor) domain-containing protein [Thermosyntropha lipolytica DSM 11003]
MDTNLVYCRTADVLKDKKDLDIKLIEALEAFFLVTDEDYNIVMDSKGVRDLWHLEELKKEIYAFKAENKEKIINLKIDGKQIKNFKLHREEFIDEKGERYLVFWGADITDIIREKDKAEQVGYIKSEFVASISHEVRNALVGILGFCEIMQNEEDKLKLREGIEIIHCCARQLLGLVNDVLDLSKIETRQIEIRKEKFNLFRLIKQTLFSLQPKIEKKGLALGLVIDEKIPEDVLGDEVRLRQVLNNLLLNAVQYTDEGYVKLEVNLLSEGEVQFAVYDTGIGIKEEDIGRVFRPFVRLRDGERRSGGSGLGLAITRELVSLMGGRIWYKPNGEKGSIFGFSLPLQEAQMEENMMEKGWFDGFGYALTSCKQILLVEDIGVNRKLIGYMLKNLGYEVIDVENGQRCLEVLKEKRPDVILLDMQMPVLDGYQTVKIIRETEGIKDIPVIALTAYAMEGDGEKCLKAGCDYYLSKPFTQEQLKRALDICLYNKGPGFNVG